MASASASKSTIGRPKGLMWDYFRLDKAECYSRCIVNVDGDGKIHECEAKINGKFTTNLKNHLRKHHPDILKELERKEKDKKGKARKQQHHLYKRSETERQLSLTECVRKKTYDVKSEKYKKITKKLAIFIGSTNVQYSIVKSQEFKDLLDKLDLSYRVPSQSALSKQLEQVLVDISAKIKSHVKNARKFHITCDIWTKKGMSESFLGVTAHFIANKKLHLVTLALRKMPSPHTGERIYEFVQDILSEWDVRFHQHGKILTHNGSNMVKAFRSVATSTLEENVAKESEDEEEMDGTHGSQLRDNDDMEKGSEIDDESEEAGLDDDDFSDEIADFEEKELDHEISFSSFNRLSCFAHTLQLVVAAFDGIKSLKRVIKKAHAIASKVNKSNRATEKLINLSGKKLVSDCSTRWSSTYLLISRLLEVQAGLSQGSGSAWVG